MSKCDTRPRHGIKQWLRGLAAELSEDLRREAAEACERLELRIAALEADNRELKANLRTARAESSEAMRLWDVMVSNGE